MGSPAVTKNPFADLGAVPYTPAPAAKSAPPNPFADLGGVPYTPAPSTKSVLSNPFADLGAVAHTPTPPPVPSDQPAFSAAPGPSLLEQARRTVANSGVGQWLEQRAPAVGEALHLTPTESQNSPTYQQHGEQLLAPEYLAPAVEKYAKPVANGMLFPGAPPLFDKQPMSEKNKARIEGALGAAGGLTSGQNLATMAGVSAATALTGGVVNPATMKVLERLVAGGFTLDMLHGLYQQHKEYRDAVDRGDTDEAHRIQGAMGVNGVLSLLTGADAVHPSLFHPAGKVTGIDHETGLPIVDRRQPAGTPPREPEAPAGEAKPVLHGTDDVEALRASAERQAEGLGDAVGEAAKGVPGAEVAAVRDAKDSDRITDKAERQGVQPSQIADIAAAKVTVPDQAAADAVLKNLHEQMPVESVNGTVDGEAQKNGVRQVQAVVDLKAPDGEPVKKAEVLIQTPEMAAAAERTHDDYRRSQELRAEGKDAEAEALEAKIEAEHEKAAKSASQPEGAEPKYKFGNTQANIPEGSDAHGAIETARGRIDDKDLAGDGKDIGGNHVTVRYGIQGDDTATIEKYLRSQSPFEAKLGKISSFPPSENSDGAAVLKADIEAPELHRLNKEIEQHGDFKKSDFPDYKPHATIAYVKPEAAEKYTGSGDTAGKSFEVRSVAITDRNGNGKEIPLEGGKSGKEGGRGENPEQAGAAGARALAARPDIAGQEGRATEVLARGSGAGDGQPVRAPRPPAGRADTGSGAGAARPAELAPRAPRPPEAKSAFEIGRQSTPVDVRDEAGRWQAATLDYHNGGANGNPRRSRVTLADGTKRNNVTDSEMRLAPQRALPEPKAATGTPAEAAMNREVRERGDALVHEYMRDHTADGAVYIAKDAVKPMFEPYRADPTAHSEDANAAATAIQEEAMRRALAEPVKDGRDLVTVKTGAPASGKTSGATGGEDGRTGIVRESILDDLAHGREVVDQILAAGRHPVLDVNFLDDPRKNVQRMVERAKQIGRTVPLEYMAKAYVDTPRVAEELKRIYGDRITVNSIDNSGTPEEMRFLPDDGAAAAQAAKAYTLDSAREAMRGELERIQAAGEGPEAIVREARRGLQGGEAADRGGAAGARRGGSAEHQDERRQADELGRRGEDGEADAGAGNPAERAEVSASRVEADGGGSPQRQGDSDSARAGGRGQDAEGKTNAARAEEWNQQLKAAKARSLPENAAVQRSRAVEIDGRRALALDADGALTWHKLFKDIRKINDVNPLGAGQNWRGMLLNKAQSNMALAYLRGVQEDLRVSGLPDKGAGDGYERLAQALKDARSDGGSAVVLRGDYREDTAREELTHQWQVEHGLDKSDAMQEVAARPEMREIAERLREMGYQDASPKVIANELMAKALAGDQDFELTDEQRNELVHGFLTAAVEEKGPEILKDLPTADARARSMIDEVRRGYDYGGEFDQRREAGEDGDGTGVREAARGGSGPAGEEVREDDGAGTRERGGQREGRSAAEGGERGVPEGSAATGELKAPKPPSRQAAKSEKTTGPDGPVFQRPKAPRPPSMALPGMEDVEGERARMAAEDEGQRLTEELRTPGKSISRDAGEMERESPLFRGTGENPLLFQRVKGEENPVARSVSELVDELKAMPKGEKGTALDRVAGWTKDAIEDSVQRSGKALGGVPSGFEKAFAWVKATAASLFHDYMNPPAQTDWKTQAGQLQLAQTETALRLQDLAKELKAAAPKALDRIAMTHWMEAAGDESKLKMWRAGAKTRAMQEIGNPRGRYLREAEKHYEAALNLSPQQKMLAQRLRQHFDDMLDLAKKNGLLEYGYRNYVMHLYEKAEAANLLHLVDNSELNPNPNFLKKRFHDTFYSAEGDGLTPKSKDIGYLATAYDKSMNEAIASRNFMRSLLDAKAPDGRPIAAIKVRGGWVMAKGDEAPEVLRQRKRPETLDGYEDFDRPQLRNFLFKPTTADLDGFDPKLFEDDPEKLAFRGDLMIHPDFAGRVEDMLTPSWFERGGNAFQKIGNAVVKGSALAKELMTVVAPFHMVQEGVHAMEHKVNPFKLPKIDLTDKTQRLLAGNGLTLTNYDAEGLFSTKMLKGRLEPVPGLNKAMDAAHSLSQWTFQDYIPKLKMKMATEAFERNTKRYPDLSPEQVAELTAKQSNAAFGNLNSTFDKIPRTKTFKTLLRLAFFAPDFLESRMRFVGQALKPYGGEQRAALVRGALAMYVVARVTNSLLNNGDAKWDMEHAFSVVHNGKAYALRTLQGDVLHAVTDPRGFIYNRLNPLTSRPIVEFMSGRDQFGRQKSGLHQVEDVAKSALPFALQKATQTADEGWLNSILTSTGLQAGNYRTPTEEEVHKLYLAHIPDLPDDEEREAESRKVRQIEDKVRSGHMSPAEVWEKVKSGELTAREAGRTIQRANKSRLEIEFQSLSLKDAMKVYADANPVEKMELKASLGRKRALIAELPEADREKTAEKINGLLAQNGS